MHRIDPFGGQERSTLEFLSRLARQGTKVRFYGFLLAGWPDEVPIDFHRVPGQWLPVQWFKNLWFSLFTYFTVPEDQPIMTTGVSSWKADLRVIQFCHSAFWSVLACLNREGKPQPLPDDVAQEISDRIGDGEVYTGEASE